MRVPRVLITGGAGFIGSHLARRIVQDGLAYVCIVDNLQRGEVANLRNIPGEIDLRVADVRNLDYSVFEGFDTIYHLAAQSNVIGAAMDAEYCFTTNVLGTYRVLEAAAKAGVRRLVFASSREVYGEPSHLPVSENAPLIPKNLYGASKCAGEALCHGMGSGGLETVILRLANVYGPCDRGRVIPIFAGNAFRKEPLVLFGGDQTIDFIWVGDVVEALVRAGFGDYIRGPVNIGSGHAVSVRELASRIVAATGSSSEVRVVPARQIEVSQYRANSDRGRRLLGLCERPDPLWRLPETLEWLRDSAVTEGIPMMSTSTVSAT